MDSKTKSSSNQEYIKIIKQYEYDLELKQFKINDLENLCDKQTIQIEEKIIEIEEKDKEIEEKDKEIQNLLELLKIENPDLFKVYKGQLTPY